MTDHRTMNAINLPVQVVHQWNEDYSVIDSSGRSAAFEIGKDKAEEIALALNCHDALVEALGFYGSKPEECRNSWNSTQPGNMNDWCREVEKDGGDIARATLAKVEDLRKKV